MKFPSPIAYSFDTLSICQAPSYNAKTVNILCLGCETIFEIIPECNTMLPHKIWHVSPTYDTIILFTLNIQYIAD